MKIRMWQSPAVWYKDLLQLILHFDLAYVELPSNSQANRAFLEKSLERTNPYV